MGRRFNAFGHAEAIESMGQPDHAANDLAIFGAIEHVDHKGAIDLEAGDRQFAQIGEG